MRKPVLRLHIQNPEHEPTFAFTPAQWREAIERNPDMANIDVSMGSDASGFDRALSEAEILLTWVDIVGRRFRGGGLKDTAPRLKVISCNAAGVDRLAPFDWLPGDVVLLNNSGIHSDKAGEFGMMALLMLQNQMPALIQAQHNAAWTPLHSATLRGRTLGIVGMGALGSGVARRARAFGMRVIGVRNSAEPHPDCDETVAADDLDTFLPRVDDLVLACPLTPRTRNLLSRARIALLPKGARVINIARGAVWDQEAICDALDSENLESAFTDVAVPEPLDPGHRLWRTRGMIVTPHIGADDRDRYNDVTLDILFANLRAAREDKVLPNRVDPQKGY
jgi:glyoxylate/hydroxypyruvate reductase A